MTIHRVRFAAAAAAIGLLALASAACGGSASPKIIKVFGHVPWTGNETARYNLVDHGGNLTGTCQLNTKVETKPGQTTLEQLCTSAGGKDRGRYTDDSSATVESQTLKPLSATRTTSDTQKHTQTTFTSTYSATDVKFRANDNGTLHGADRDLPKPSNKSPDPGYYDDVEFMWVMRGITLQKGWEGAYIDVNAGTGALVTAHVKVIDQEKVTVPAGTYTTWKAQLSTSSVTQFFWIDASSPHLVIQAVVEDTTYELTSAK